MRTVIIGGPRCGKSTTAIGLALRTGAQLYCADHYSKVKEPQTGVTYLREDISWYQPGPYIVGEWFQHEPPWIIEGSTLVRALRYWVEEGFEGAPCDEIILRFVPMVATLSPGQLSLLKGVQTIWNQVSPYYHALDHIKIHS